MFGHRVPGTHLRLRRLSVCPFFFMPEDFDLIFCVLFYHDKLQVKFDFHDLSFSPCSVKALSIELFFL